jgi:hypothetical protein
LLIGKDGFWDYNKSVNYFFKKIISIDLFPLFGLFWIGLGFLALILAFSGFFYAWIIAGYIFLGVIFLLPVLIKNIINFNFQLDYLAVILISFLAIILFSHFSVPTVFTGRDQGSLSNAAIMLSQNHKLAYDFPAEKEFFKIYGKGTALNFPGFNYNSEGSLVPHFPFGYISWLAAFYLFFGLGGFAVANGFSFFLFAISFYTLARNYMEKFPALAAFSLMITSFIFSWFFKFTLSENLALGLVWFGLAQFVFFLKENKKIYALSFLLSFGLLVFARIEALAFLAIAIVILFFKHKKIKNLSVSLGKNVIFAAVILLIIFIFSLKINAPFYTNLAKGFLNSFFVSGIKSDSAFFSELIYLWKLFFAYALAPYIIIGILGFFYLWKKKMYSAIFPCLIIFPAFIYLANPSISSDHPWMLRRYVFAVIPFGILYTVIFLDKFLKKRPCFHIFFLLMLISNLALFIPYITVRENENLLRQTQKISVNFEKNDLVLVDREASGSGWSMLAGPLNLLYEKQAVYFFNPEDLEKIDLSSFSKVYFIIPDKNMTLYEESNLKDRLVFVEDYFIENSLLSAEKYSPLLPIYQKNYIYGKIYSLK